MLAKKPTQQTKKLTYYEKYKVKNKVHLQPFTPNLMFMEWVLLHGSNNMFDPLTLSYASFKNMVMHKW